MRLLLFVLFFPVLFFSQQKEKGAEFINLLLVKKEFNSAYSFFSEEMKTQISLPVLQQTVEQIEGQLGKFKNVIEVNNENKNIYFYYSEFEKAKLDIQIAFDDKSQIIGFFFVPHKEFGKNENLLNSFNIKSESIMLKGTLLVPKENDKKKLVIFIHGSGPNDRDETVGENKPFKNIAEYLLNNGIASYRYDKRTLSNPETFSDNSTAEQETINDVVNVFNFFVNDEQYKNYKIILLGHSFGGYLLPKIYQKTPEVSKLVFLAANARPLQDIIVEQLQYLNKIDPSNVSAETIQTTKKQVDFLNSKKFNLSSKNSDLPFGLSANYWKYLLDYNTFDYLKSIHIPMFFGQGGRDYQVTDKDFNLWQNQLKNSKYAVFKLYPQLNHFFINGSINPSPKDYNVKGSVDERFLKNLEEFILE